MNSRQSTVRQTSKLAPLAVSAPVFAAGFAFSAWLLAAYDAGDQAHYERFWYAAEWAYPWQWAALQVRYLGSSDALYSLLIGLGNYTGIDRIVYISLWNGLFTALVAEILRRYKAGLFFSLLLFSNFYLLVLLGPAERLKFAYILLAMSVCLTDYRLRFASAVAAIFFHTQAIFQFGASAIYYVFTEYKTILRNRWSLLASAVLFPAVLGGSVLYIYLRAGDIISQKSEIYSNQSQGVLEVVQWALILVAGCAVFRYRIAFLASMLPLGVFTMLFGNRINIATLALFCAVALAQDRTRHPVVVAIMAYMSFKSIGFIINVLETGQGFS